jgi:hypothetical protein
MNIIMVTLKLVFKYPVRDNIWVAKINTDQIKSRQG